MWRSFWIATLTALAVALGGCGGQEATDPGQQEVRTGQSGGAQQGADAEQGGPTAAVFEFLEAVRTGDDRRATAMLSAAAREKTGQSNRRVTPSASDTAQFEIGQVQYVAEDGARVACTWTDLDADGQPRTEKATWMVRREEPGWRIVGVAYTVFEGELPLLLNFEDPEDMFRKQQWVREEIRRRAENAALQARSREDPENTIRR